jgi:hypothetical protein
VSFVGGTLSATGSGGTVTNVTGTAPVVSSGGATPAISMAAATTSVNGYLTSTDWNTFNGKAPAVTFTSGRIPYGQGTTTLNQSANLTFDGTNFATTGNATANTFAATGSISAHTVNGENQLGSSAVFGLMLIGKGSTNNSTIFASNGGIALSQPTGTYNIDIPNGNLSVGGSITPSQTGGIIGTTTNNNADAGSVGEYVSSTVAVASAVALTSGAGTNITAISLTAGDWDVYGRVGVYNATAAIWNWLYGECTTASATLGNEDYLVTKPDGASAALANFQMPVPTIRLSLASTTTVNLVILASYTGGTGVVCFGKIFARRRR